MQDAEPITELAFRAEGGDADAQYRMGVVFLSGQRAEQDLTAARRWFHAAALSGHAGGKAIEERICRVSENSPATRTPHPIRLLILPTLVLAGLSMNAGYEASVKIESPQSILVQQSNLDGLPTIAKNAGAAGGGVNMQVDSPQIQAGVQVRVGARAASRRNKFRTHKLKGN